MADFVSQLPVRLYGYDGANYVEVKTDALGNLQMDLLTDAQRYTDGTAIGAQVGIPAMGTDGSNLQFISVDASGNVNIADGGNTITVDGTVVVSSISSTVTVDTEISTYDFDTGTGTDTQAGIGIFYADAGGHVLVSPANPLPVAASITINAEHVDDSAFTVDADYVSAVGFLADEAGPDSVDEGDIGIPRMTLDRKILVRIVGATDANRLDVDASGLAQVDLADHAITNLNALPVSANNTANSEVNPIFVQMASGVSGTEVHDYDTAAAVAKDGTDNHDYTVTGSSTFLLKRIIATGSGSMKIEVQVGPVASLVSKAVGFNSTATPNIEIVFDPPLEVPDTNTGTVRVIRTNRDNQAQDLYSTIMGSEV